jgi:hypothetical protein
MVTYEEISKRWKEDGDAKTVRGWLKQMKNTEKALADRTSAVHQWWPLEFYTSTGRGTSISVRAVGQEVGEIVLGTDGAHFSVTQDRVKQIRKYFHLDVCAIDGKKWKGKEAALFRRTMSDMDLAIAKPKTPEHVLESALLKRLVGKKPAQSPLRSKTAITLGGLPLHFPVPMGGHGGKLSGQGSIDVFARHGRGRLAVWELKSPKKYADALIQAYIYACQILLILRDPDIGLDYYNLFLGGAKREIVPKKLTVDVVIMIDCNEKKQLITQYQKILKELTGEKGTHKDTFNFLGAYYDCKDVNIFEPHDLTIEPLHGEIRSPVTS